MVKSGKRRWQNCFAVIILFSILSCSDEFIPPGLYDYQVERLLSADTNKTWTVSSLIIDGVSSVPENCSDSLFILFESESDSLIVQSLSRVCSSSDQFDTTMIGKASASSIGNIFNDSINFSDGSYWIIEDITSVNCRIRDEFSTPSTIYQLAYP